MKFAGFIGVYLFVMISGPLIVLGVPEIATSSGISMVVADYFGKAIVPLAVGTLGLLNKSNRFAGYVVVTLLTLGVMMLGQGSRSA